MLIQPEGRRPATVLVGAAVLLCEGADVERLAGPAHGLGIGGEGDDRAPEVAKRLRIEDDEEAKRMPREVVVKSRGKAFTR